MNYAKLDDGRVVIIDTARKQVSVHTQEPCPSTHVNVLLGGHWQTVRRERLTAQRYGSPFSEVLNEK